jgi:cell shape-determining protein MreC
MESVLKSDLFFIITSISVVIITVLLSIAGIYFIKILRNFYKISSLLKDYVENTGDELKDIKNHIRQSKLFVFLFGKEKIRDENLEKKKKMV